MTLSAAELVAQLAEKETPPDEVIQTLAEGYGEHEFSTTDMLTAMTDGITYSLASLGTIIEGVVQTLGYPGDTGVLGQSVADAYRIVVASSLYDSANKTDADS